jgi:hypothetical protein
MDARRQSPGHGESGARVYLLVLAVAAIIGIGLALYVSGYRQEILAILTQSPT